MTASRVARASPPLFAPDRILALPHGRATPGAGVGPRGARRVLRENAVPIAGFHSAVPAGRGRRLLRGGAVGRGAADGPDHRLARVLRLVGCPVPAASDRPDHRVMAAVAVA